MQKPYQNPDIQSHIAFAAPHRAATMRLLDLPDTALLCILQQLGPNRDAVSLGMVCHQMHYVFDHEVREACKQASIKRLLKSQIHLVSQLASSCSSFGRISLVIEAGVHVLTCEAFREHMEILANLVKPTSFEVVCKEACDGAYKCVHVLSFED